MAKTPDTVREGGALYAKNCAACHDASGMGHGEAGLALYPSPALLAHLIRMPGTVDEYLLWAISDGGKPFGTKMPAFKDVLAEEQIGQIIIYMRAGFPAMDTLRRVRHMPLFLFLLLLLNTPARARGRCGRRSRTRAPLVHGLSCGRS